MLMQKVVVQRPLQGKRKTGFPTSCWNQQTRDSACTGSKTHNLTKNISRSISTDRESHLLAQPTEAATLFLILIKGVMSVGCNSQTGLSKTRGLKLCTRSIPAQLRMLDRSALINPSSCSRCTSCISSATTVEASFPSKN